MADLVAYLLLFTGVGIGFVLGNLTLGKILRPAKMDAEKATVYECGEPTIGSAWIQFDLRFYVVALLFVIFDVEMAFFFPWAVVFGKSNEIASSSLTREQRLEQMSLLDPQDRAVLTDQAIYQADTERRRKFHDDLLKEMEEQNSDQDAARTKLRKRNTELQV